MLHVLLETCLNVHTWLCWSSTAKTKSEQLTEKMGCFRVKREHKRQGMQPRMGFCVYFRSGWLHGQLDWKIVWLKTAPLLAESVFSQSNYLIWCTGWLTNTQGRGKGRWGRTGQDLTFWRQHVFRLLKAVVRLDLKITAERQLEYRWDSISSEDQHSAFSSFAPFKVIWLQKCNMAYWSNFLILKICAFSYVILGKLSWLWG